jgi:hypothetical protein
LLARFMIRTSNNLLKAVKQLINLKKI